MFSPLSPQTCSGCSLTVFTMRTWYRRMLSTNGRLARTLRRNWGRAWPSSQSPPSSPGCGKRRRNRRTTDAESKSSAMNAEACQRKTKICRDARAWSSLIVWYGSKATRSSLSVAWLEHHIRVLFIENISFKIFLKPFFCYFLRKDWKYNFCASKIIKHRFWTL